MADKVYTAQEMRVRADKEERHWHDHVTAAMLRQAADALGREEKYEYAVEYYDKTNGKKSLEFITNPLLKPKHFPLRAKT